MRYRLSIMALAVLAGLAFLPIPATAQRSSSSSQKVLAQKSSGFNVKAVEAFLKQGDAAISAGKVDEARENYDKARAAAKQLLSFYRDLSGSFRGLDARIPREMDSKGRKSLVLLAEVNLRLAALFRRENMPEVAVPLLIEVVKLMTPAKPEGQKAYQRLLELGFVDTPYAGASSNNF